MVFGPLRLTVGVSLNVDEGDCWEGITNSWIELPVLFFRDVGPDFSIVMKTIVLFFISHAPYGFVVDGQCMIGLQGFWRDC